MEKFAHGEEWAYWRGSCQLWRSVGVTVWRMHHLHFHQNLLLSKAMKAAGGEPWNFLDLKHSDLSLTWFINQRDGANVLHWWAPSMAMLSTDWMETVAYLLRKGEGGREQGEKEETEWALYCKRRLNFKEGASALLACRKFKKNLNHN